MYSYQLYFRDFCELIKQSASSWLDNSVVRALHRYHRAHGLESRSVLTYFSGFLHATPPQVAYIIRMIFIVLKCFIKPALQRECLLTEKKSRRLT